MQRLEVSGAVRPIYGSLGVKRLIDGSRAVLLPHVLKGLGSDLEWDWYFCDVRSVFRHLQFEFILLPPPVLCYVEWYQRPT